MRGATAVAGCHAAAIDAAVDVRGVATRARRGCLVTTLSTGWDAATLVTQRRDTRQRVGQLCCDCGRVSLKQEPVC